MLASPGGHYWAPDFILVLNITNKGGSSVIKRRCWFLTVSVRRRLLTNSNQRGVNPGYTMYILAHTHTHTPFQTSVYFYSLEEINMWKHDDIREVDIFSRAACWSKQRNISDSSFQSVSLSACSTLAWFASLSEQHLIIFAFWAHERDLLVLSLGCCYMSCQAVSWLLQLPRCNLSPSLSLSAWRTSARHKTRQIFGRKLNASCFNDCVINVVSHQTPRHVF